MKVSTFWLNMLAILVLASPAKGQSDSLGNTISANGEDFALFESLENTPSNSASSVAGRNNSRERGTRNTSAAPTFTLLGTSRIGNSYGAILKHMSGETVRVPLTGNVNEIPGFESYVITDSSAGQVRLRHPSSAPCASFPDQGVNCDSETNVATLSLTTADALILAGSEESAEDQEQAEVLEEGTRNPFEAIRERGRANSTSQATESTRFQPRRIDPADVPPGMRVVSTPFGDRLVQQ